MKGGLLCGVGRHATAGVHQRWPHALAATLTQALLLESVDRSTAKEIGSKRGVGAGTDSYYEYLVKSVSVAAGVMCWRAAGGLESGRLGRPMPTACQPATF